MENKVWLLLIFASTGVCLYSTYTTQYSDTSILNQQMMPSRPLLSESVITMQKRNVQAGIGLGVGHQKAAFFGQSHVASPAQEASYRAKNSAVQKASSSIFEYFNTKFEHVCTIFNNVIKLFSDDIREYIRAFDYVTMSQIKFLIPLSQQLQMEYEEFLAQEQALAAQALGQTTLPPTQVGEGEEVLQPAHVAAPPPPAQVPTKFKNDFFVYNFKYAGAGQLHKGFQGFRADIESAVGISFLYKPLFFAFKKARFEHVVVISGANEFWLKAFALIYNAKDKKVSELHCAAEMLMLCWRLSKTKDTETVEKAYQAHALHLLQFFKTLSFQNMDVTTFIMKCYAMGNQLRVLENETKVASAVLNDFGPLTKKVLALVLGMLEKYDHLIERGLEKKDSKIRDLHKQLSAKDLRNASQRDEAFKLGKQLHDLLDGWNDFKQLFGKKVASVLSASPLYKQHASMIDTVYLEVFDPFLSRASMTWHDIRPQVRASTPQGEAAAEQPQFSFDLMKEIVT